MLDSSVVLKKLHSGGIPALTRLFDDNRDALRCMLNKRILGKLGARFDESDIIQEAFLRASNRLEGYLKSPKVHPHVWIRILCRQMLAEQMRKNFLDCRTPTKESNMDSGEAKVEMLIDSTDSVGTKLGRREAMTKILSKLSETDREILTMRHSENLVFREIADSLEMKVDTVKKRYYRAVSRLDLPTF